MSNVTAMDPAPATMIHAKQGTLFGDVKKGPMNSNWFYSGVAPHDTANKLHQLRKWGEAAEEYRKAKDQILTQHTVHKGAQQIIYIPTEQEVTYAKHMGRLNLAACLMAQRQASKHWKSFDYLIGIPKEKRISGKMIKACDELRDKLVKVRTDKVRDVFHFMHGAILLKQSTGCYIVFAVRDFLKDTLSSFATAYDISIVGENENQPETDYETHLISLLGYLELKPSEVVPPRVVLTAPERAMIAVLQQVQPILALRKTIMTVFLGEENCQETLIGGKQLPRDSKDHGRHLDSEPFRVLLQKHPYLLLMDCGTKDSKVTVDENQKDRYMQLASEEQAFDTTIALALLMNMYKKIIAFGTDNGPTNVFARALDKEAQKRMAFIIPNGSKNHGEYDMRMEGEGQVYKHMLYDNVSVYKCAKPSKQTEVINMAYDDIMEQDSHPVVYSFTIGKEDLKAETLEHQ